MNLNTVVVSNTEDSIMDVAEQSYSQHGLERVIALEVARKVQQTARPALSLIGKRPSPWARSSGKRIFDCACVVAALPVLIPILLAIGLVVRLTSRGPVLFLQKRVGRHGQLFTILKFRSMVHVSEKAHFAVTTAGNQKFTSVGPFLRRFKLDELPQLLNVLWGDMSMVGPRPKMPEHVIDDLPCRPGITGAATIAFAREELVLDRVPGQHLESFYHATILPAKRRLDAEYMARATFRSDMSLIVNSVLRRWDDSIIESLLASSSYRTEIVLTGRERWEPAP